MIGGLISAGISKYGFDAIYSALMIRLSDQGIALGAIELKLMDSWWLSRSLKNKIRRQLGLATE